MKTLLEAYIKTKVMIIIMIFCSLSLVKVCDHILKLAKCVNVKTVLKSQDIYLQSLMKMTIIFF